MRYQELFEGAAEDLDQANQAKRIADAFSKYLAKHNESTPLEEDNNFRETPGRGQTYLTISGPSLGLDQHADLRIGFAWNNNGSPMSEDAKIIRAISPDGPVYLAVICMDKDPSKETDLAFSIRWGDLVHELVHYLDYGRSTLKNADRDKQIAKRTLADDYYNDPLELNAYYQMGVADIMGFLVFLHQSGEAREKKQFGKRLSELSYAEWKKAFLPHFKSNWLTHLTPENKRRFERRFYKMYDLVVSNWPDVDVIKGEADRMAQETWD